MVQEMSQYELSSWSTTLEWENKTQAGKIEFAYKVGCMEMTWLKVSVPV